MQFTKDDLKDLKPADKTTQYTKSDPSTKGLLIVIGRRRADGTVPKSFMVQTEVRRNGIRRTYKRTLGAFPGLSIAAARKAARAMIAELEGGPVKPKGKGVTVTEAWERYRIVLERKVDAGKRSQRTVDAYADHFGRILKSWADIPLRALAEDLDLVADRFNVITKKNGRITANRSLQSLAIVYKFARKRMDRTLPSGLPTDGIDWHEETRRKSAMGYDQLAGWYVQLKAIKSPVRRAFHEFVLLSGGRPNAVRQARWEHLDREVRTLTFPGAIMKSGHEFILPLSAEMIAVLDQAQGAGEREYRIAAREWIFPSRVGCVNNTQEPKSVLSAWGSTLRETWATAARAVGISELFTHVLLAHSLGGTSQGYVRPSALGQPLWDAQEAVSRYLTAGMRGEEFS